MKVNNWVILLILFLVIFDVFIWSEVVFGGENKNTEVYFLDVGQGDSELVILPNNVKILIDGGKNNKVINELSPVFSPFDRYLDLVVLSHPQLDHFGGLIEVLKRYQVGAFIFNGREGQIGAFSDLKKELRKNQILILTLAEGDKIKYQENYFDVLSPSKNLLASSDLNDTCLVLKLASQGAKILFTADIGAKVENYLIEKQSLGADILKVSHHGSKYSSTKEFLLKVAPKIAVIEVGEHNPYRHPTPEVLSRLAAINSQIFRTDLDGTIKLTINNQRLNIFKKKAP